MQKSFWWWQCSDRYIIALFPHLHTPLPPFSPSLISRTVYVDVKHHVYFLFFPTSRDSQFPQYLAQKTSGSERVWETSRRSVLFNSILECPLSRIITGRPDVTWFEIGICFQRREGHGEDKLQVLLYDTKRCSECGRKVHFCFLSLLLLLSSSFYFLFFIFFREDRVSSILCGWRRSHYLSHYYYFCVNCVWKGGGSLQFPVVFVWRLRGGGGRGARFSYWNFSSIVCLLEVFNCF